MTQRTTEVSIMCGPYGEEHVFLTAPWSSETGFSPYTPRADLWRRVQDTLGDVERDALAVGVAVTLSAHHLQDAGLGVAYSVVIVREVAGPGLPRTVHTMTASGRMGAGGWRAVQNQWEWEATSLMDACASEARPRICALVCTISGVSRIIHVLDSETWRLLEKFLYWIGEE